jgi:histidinol-phosphatase
MSNFIADLALAQTMADAADEISLARFRALDLNVETKPDRSPVTDADRAVELALKNILADHRPTDSIIGEEYGNSSGSGVTGENREWIIDPIDGTANYMRGLPVWATLIALAVDGKPVVSVVSAPALGRRWWAAPESGAFTRDISGELRELKVSKISDLENASLSYNNLQLWDSAGYLDALMGLSRKVWRTRAFGDFLSYMFLAEGSLEVVAEHDLKVYDIAALVPIVEQAGGKFSAFDGPLTQDTSSVLATNGSLHTAVQVALRQ